MAVTLQPLAGLAVVSPLNGDGLLGDSCGSVAGSDLERRVAAFAGLVEFAHLTFEATDVGSGRESRIQGVGEDVRRQVGIVDLADLLYVRSQYFVSRQIRHGDASCPPEKPILFGEKEGKIALANRRKEPLLLLSALPFFMIRT